ncbi:MAG: sodium:solute symporter family transporter [Pontiellaceae bacterium]
MIPTSFGLLNTTILILYLFGMLLIGWLFSRHKQNAEQFFLGGRNLPWLAVAMSMYASLTSAVTYIGLPATAYQENIALIAVSFASLAVAPIILKLFYPFYHRHQVTTSYQFIQQRFGPNAQRSVATLFVLSRLGWLGTVVYAPALALAAATGFSLTTCILLMGLIATLYTTLGGMAAVVWTDTLQFLILVGGAIWIALSLVHQIDGGAITILSHAASTGRLDILDWPPSLFSLSLPIVAISFFFQLMQEYGTDQITVQRMMATGSQRKTFKAILFNAGTDLVVISTLLFIGLGLLSFYQLNPLPADIAPDSLMPYYIIHQLPNGVNGLLITAIFAAAMSSMDSGINAVATVLLNDYKKPKNKIVTKARGITILLGILATGIAFYVSSIGGLIKAFYSFMGLFSAPILALFLLGVLNRRMAFHHWLIGLAVSLPFTLWLQHGLGAHWVWYFPSSFIVAFVVSAVASCFSTTSSTA